MASEMMHCNVSMPKGSRAIITIGEVKGTMDIVKTMPEFGSETALMLNTSPRMIGTIAKDWSCEASWILSTAEPMAA